MVIVAAIDRSERADDVIQQAETLAEAFGDTIHVVHVLTTSEFIDLGIAKAEEGDSIDAEQVIDAGARIAEETAAALGRSYEAVGLLGDPADRVVEYADEHDARYVVVAGRKRSPTGKAIFGSTAQSILLNAGRPVVMTTSPR